MATTQEWIDWSRNVARPYWHTNHQLFLEVAMAACRHYRDSGGLSADQELANAEHYWFMRWMCFACGGAGGDIAATPSEVLSPTVAQIAGRISAHLAMAASGIAISVFAVAWHSIKALCFAVGVEDWIPGGDGPASRPTVEQLEWAMRGYQDALLLDAPYMEQMRWGSVLADIPGMIVLPPPLR
jgi:hypothetical protein